MKHVFKACLIAVALAVAGQATAALPLVNEPVIATPGAKVAPTGSITEGKSLYLCHKSLIDGTVDCQLVHTSDDASVSVKTPIAVTANNVEKLDWAEILAVYRAVRTSTATPILFPGETGPVDACANTHGASGCCMVVAGEIGGGNVVVECHTGGTT